MFVKCRQAEQSAHQNEGEWVPGAGWFASACKPPSGPSSRQIDRLRAELRTEFNAAVRHAYLGPRYMTPQISSAWCRRLHKPWHYLATAMHKLGVAKILEHS